VTKTMDPPADERSVSRETVKQLTPVAYVLGLALIVLYFVGLALAWSSIGGSDSDWGRRLQVLGGVEALAFAAAGAILGTTVQRQATQKEQERAVRAERKAQENELQARKGEAVLNLAAARAGLSVQPDQRVERARDTFAPHGSRGGDSVAEAFQDLLALADQYDASR